jgi:formylglycine-generating enzyme required for sulfatase activity
MLLMLAALAMQGPAYADGAPQALRDPHGMDFRLVSPGTFTMGSDDPGFAPGQSLPPRTVTITRTFYLGATEVTQEAWERVMGSNPSTARGPALPVEGVAMADVDAFLARLNSGAGDWVYRLPTEAEWEYAARAGTATLWHTGADPGGPSGAAPVQEAYGYATREVGQGPANPWGFHDMYGNVREWVSDWHSPDYPDAESGDPAGPATGTARVTRGGSFCGEPLSCSSPVRYENDPGDRLPYLGLRLVYENVPPVTYQIVPSWY